VVSRVSLRRKIAYLRRQRLASLGASASTRCPRPAEACGNITSNYPGAACSALLPAEARSSGKAYGSSQRQHDSRHRVAPVRTAPRS